MMTAQKFPAPAVGVDGLFLRLELEAFNAEYARVLDDGDLRQWPAFFTDDATYVVTARENYDANLPVGLIYCEGKGMMEDRALAIRETAMFAPRYLRHYITNLLVEPVKDGGTIHATANYLVLETLLDNPEAHIHQTGRYIDRFVRVDGALRLKQRHCVYDNLMVPTSLVLPI
ncbi:aromatic-ring-hydroxylating dioxygenase subunit beta [Virgifigura deserti]|uniref:aromatic-ring-hydroxylating dioxygenase subunit beta n=1 Tax=Virgifigura deserti TaxID=2268457 RepID=UPI003CCC393F